MNRQAGRTERIAVSTFANAHLVLTVPNEEGLREAAERAAELANMLDSESNMTQVSLRYKTATTSVAPNSTADQVVASIEFKLSPSYTSNDGTYQ